MADVSQPPLRKLDGFVKLPYQRKPYSHDHETGTSLSLHMDPAEQKSRRGRPPRMSAAEREALVVTCAIELFSEKGPENVTMDDVAGRTGMSKRTLYTIFQGRQELIGAALNRISRTLFRPLLPEERTASLEERLRILLTIHPATDDPTLPLDLLRLVIAEAKNYPGMGRSLYEDGPGRIVGLVADELRSAAGTGEIRISESEIPAAAELLVDMIVGNTVPWLLDPDRILHSPADREERRHRAITIFLNGVCRI